MRVLYSSLSSSFSNDFQVLSHQQQRLLPSHPLRGTPQVGALPGGPLPGHLRRRSRHHGRRVVGRQERRARHDRRLRAGKSGEKGDERHR